MYLSKGFTTTDCINGELRPRDLVISTHDSEYGYLVGTVKEIIGHGTPEHDTGNPGDDVHVDFTNTAYDS